MTTLPHDRNKTLLAVGDEVMLRARVASIQAGEEYYNVTLESIDGRVPDGQKESFCLNSGVCIKIADAPAQAAHPGAMVTKTEPLPAQLSPD